MIEQLANWIRAHKTKLLGSDFKMARLLGAPKGMTLSGYSYKLEQEGKPWGKFWRPIIDKLALVIFKQTDHCRKACEKETQISSN